MCVNEIGVFCDQDTTFAISELRKRPVLSSISLRQRERMNRVLALLCEPARLPAR